MDPELEQAASALLRLAFFASTGALFLAVIVGFLVKGPTRWVKILTALMTLSFLGSVGAMSGFGRALAMAGGMLAITAGSMAAGMLFWSQPRRKTLQPTSPQSCPSHAKRKVDRWSSELHGLGFSFHSDQTYQWRFGNSPKNVFVRFFSHPSEPMRAELYALDNPKTAARILASRTAGGKELLSCDQQSDTEHFRSATVETRRLSSKSTTESMVNEHRSAVQGLGGAVPAGDPVAAHLDGYHRWVEDLVETGIVTARDDAIRVKLRSMPGIILRVLGAWFH